jgi:PAS domain S-box-containing protein
MGAASGTGPEGGAHACTAAAPWRNARHRPDASLLIFPAPPRGIDTGRVGHRAVHLSVSADDPWTIGFTTGPAGALWKDWFMAEIATGFDTPILLDRDVFMRRLIAGFGHLNEGILGSEVTGAYVMNVGLSMGAAIEAEYKRFWGIDRPFTLDEYAHVIVDLKRRIQGNFWLVSKDPEKVVVRTTSCPFDEFVHQSPSLCFMTSSVFGGIAARNFGYAKVVLHERIALGDPGCHVTVYLRRTAEADAAVGKEYFPDIDEASPDIAEQLQLMDNVRRLRRELSQASSQWEEIVRGAADAITVLEQDGQMIYANARWRDLLGVEGEELLGGTLLRLVHPDDQPRLAGALDHVSAGRRAPSINARLRHRDGTWREALVSLGPVRGEHGQTLTALAILHDVTTERETARLKDSLQQRASHELRTPVTTIKGMTDLLLRSLDAGQPLDPAQLTHRLRMIQHEADRLTSLARDLATVAQFRPGSLPVMTERHDLNDIVATSVAKQRDLLPPAPPYRLTFRPAPAPLWVWVERVRIEEAVTNLIANAVKYSPDGGEVQVRLAREGNMACLQVTDEGIGIPEPDLSSLFTPFFRASNAPVENFPGLGLGLYLSREFVIAHGGDLHLVSAEGRGTTATLTLPCAEEQDS